MSDWMYALSQGKWEEYRKASTNYNISDCVTLMTLSLKGWMQ